jgi:hypothetical protein
MQPQVSSAFPAMSELKVHNDLIGDREALDRAWEEDGYWFFKQVLDRGSVGRLRARFVEELERQGVIDPPGGASTEDSLRYNGASLERYPFRMEPLAERAPWREMVAEAPIHEFFTRLFGVEPFWVPVAEYRATPPLQDRNRPRFDNIHQDGPYSPGIPFRICWIPLARIDADTGGLALVEGLTEPVNRHPTVNGSNTAIPVGALPADRWRRTTYEAGDLLLMNLWTPHSGLTNLSDRFRLSIDLRVMETSPRCPIIGTVDCITAESITVRRGDERVTLRIDDDTYARDTMGLKLTPTGIVEFYRSGTPVIVAQESGRATVVRPPH